VLTVPSALAPKTGISTKKAEMHGATGS